MWLLYQGAQEKVELAWVHENDMAGKVVASSREPGAAHESVVEEGDVVRVSGRRSVMSRVIACVNDHFAEVDWRSPWRVNLNDCA